MASDNQKQAKKRSNQGLSLETSVVRDHFESDPSRGGSRGYPMWYRLHAIEATQQHGVVAAQQMLTPSPCINTLKNWLDRLVPYEMKGNKRRKLVGIDQLLLSVYLIAYPDATQDEVAAFLAENGTDLFSRSTISRRMRELDYSRKKASIEAYQAFLPRNLLKRDLFFSQPPPLGVNGLQRRCLTDADECGISIEQTNRRSGVAHTSIRVRKPGHYVKGHKLTVLFMIEPGDPALPPDVDGSLQNPRRWFKFIQEGGTTSEVFSEFVDGVLQEMETSGKEVDQSRVFLWDNLRSHLTNQVYATVLARDSPNWFEIVPRPPYMPKYGPTEYVFAELGSKLRLRCQPNWTYADLEVEVRNILSETGRNGAADSLFEHCGY